MKTKASIFIVSLLLAIVPTLSAKDFIVAISPEINKDMASVAWEVSNQIIEKAPEGTRLRFLSGGARPVVIADFTTQRYPNLRVKARALGEPYGALKSFLRAAALETGGRPVLASLDLPQIIAAIQDHVDKPTRLVLLGSPLWQGTSEHTFLTGAPGESDDVRFRVPSVQHLSGDPLLTPFSGATSKGLSSMDALWLNLAPAEAMSGPTAYQNVLESFYATYLNQWKITLAPIQKDTPPFMESLLGKDIGKVDPDYKRGDDLVMLTLGDLKGKAAITRPKRPALTELFVADCTKSMQPFLDQCGRNMATRGAREGQRWGLILYADYAENDGRVSFLYSESENPSDLAAAFREARLQGGGDVQEALNEGLLVARDTLRDRKDSGKVAVSIFTDAVPREPEECPPGRPSYRDLIKDILADGHAITLYRCGSELETGWVPEGVKITNL